jgi:hypothetical protein
VRPEPVAGLVAAGLLDGGAVDGSDGLGVFGPELVVLRLSLGGDHRWLPAMRIVTVSAIRTTAATVPAMAANAR